MSQVVTELVVDARGAEVGSASYVRAMQVAQQAVDRLRDRELALQAANESTGASMVATSVSTSRTAAAYDRLRASMDPVFAAAKGLERDLLTLDRAVTRLGVSEAEASRMLDMIVLKHDQAAAAARRQTEEYQRLAAAGREAQALDVSSRSGQAMWNTYAGVREPIAGAARSSAMVFEKEARASEMLAQKVAQLRAELAPLAAAQNRVNAEIAEYVAMAARGEISATELAQAQALARGRLSASQNVGGHNFAGINAGYQIQDALMMAMLGQDPRAVGLQQGPQLAMAIQQGGGLAALGSGLASLVSPTMAITVGMTAAAAASVQYFTRAEDGVDGLESKLDAHLKAVKAVSEGWDKVENSVRGAGPESQTVMSFQSQRSIEQLRETFATSTDGINFIKQFTESSFTSGRPDVTGGGRSVGIDYIDAGLEEQVTRLLQSVKAGAPDIVRFNDELASLGQAPGAADRLKRLIADTLALTSAAGEAQRTIQAFDRNVGPGGLLRGGGEFNRRDMDGFEQWRREEERTLREQRRSYEADRLGIYARSPTELAAAARASEEARSVDSESARTRALRIELAGALELERAENGLAEAQRDRMRSYDATLGSAQLNLSLVGKTASEVERLRLEYELTEQARTAAVAAGIEVSYAELTATRCQANALREMMEASE